MLRYCKHLHLILIYSFTNIFLFFQNMLEFQKEIRSILQENEDLIKMLQNVAFDDGNSIENSHL